MDEMPAGSAVTLESAGSEGCAAVWVDSEGCAAVWVDSEGCAAVWVDSSNVMGHQNLSCVAQEAECVKSWCHLQ
jgi:hypothetical protein